MLLFRRRKKTLIERERENIERELKTAMHAILERLKTK